MFRLDIPSLHAAALILLLCTITVLIVLWYTRKLEHSMTSWVAGLVCYGAAFGLYLFQESLPAASQIGIDLALVGSSLLFLQAIRSTYDLGFRQLPCLIIGLITLLLSSWIYLGTELAWPALLWRNLVVAAASGAAAVTLLRREDLQAISAEAGAALLMLCYGSVQILVSGYLLITPEINQDYLDAAMLSSRFFVTALTLAFLLISYGQLDREHRALVMKVKEESRQRIQGIESRWLLALEYSKAGAWEMDLQKREAQFSSHWAQMLGLPPRVMKMRITDIMKFVHPDDLKRLEEDTKAYVEGRTPWFENEHRLKHSSGEWIWVSSRGRFLESPANPDYKPLAGLAIDITDRKNRDRELERILAEAQQSKDQAV